MLKLDGQKLDDGRWFIGSVERNIGICQARSLGHRAVLLPRRLTRRPPRFRPLR